MAKKRKSKKGKTILGTRVDPFRKAAAMHEIDLRTKSSTGGKKKYTRKSKHKGNQDE